ncbi:MAG: hypothetical protein BAA04_00015 [Firmicutes bacterium ZCTH02-B6]|nr:MAG: hypothetical protein BAA04_00015 [Firmicutes bacterium ZCTH02-B6]
MQVGTPLEIYRRPQNTFVAGFIGSPPMNLVPCRIELAPERARLVVGQMWVDVTPLLAGIAKAFPGGGAAVLGIRPEHVQVGPAEEGALNGDLYAVSPLGDHVVITVQMGDHLVYAVQYTDEPPALPPKVGLRLQLRRVHLYRDSGELAFSGLDSEQKETVAG